MKLREARIRTDAALRALQVPDPERFIVVDERHWAEICSATGDKHTTGAAVCYRCGYIVFPRELLKSVTPSRFNSAMEDLARFILARDRSDGYWAVVPPIESAEPSADRASNRLPT